VAKQLWRGGGNRFRQRTIGRAYGNGGRAHIDPAIVSLNTAPLVPDVKPSLASRHSKSTITTPRSVVSHRDSDILFALKSRSSSDRDDESLELHGLDLRGETKATVRLVELDEAFATLKTEQIVNRRW
jgi:hypothetical protein